MARCTSEAAFVSIERDAASHGLRSGSSGQVFASACSPGCWPRRASCPRPRLGASSHSCPMQALPSAANTARHLARRSCSIKDTCTRTHSSTAHRPKPSRPCLIRRALWRGLIGGFGSLRSRESSPPYPLSHAPRSVCLYVSKSRPSVASCSLPASCPQLRGCVAGHRIRHLVPACAQHASASSVSARKHHRTLPSTLLRRRRRHLRHLAAITWSLCPDQCSARYPKAHACVRAVRSVSVSTVIASSTTHLHLASALLAVLLPHLLIALSCGRHRTRTTCRA